MKHVFISYAHSDHDFVEILRLSIEKAGYSVWIDHTGLKAGYDWRQGIDEGIKEALVLVLIISENSMQSPYVTYEWAFAFGVGIPVIPVLYKKTKLHPKLEIFQYLDFTHRLNRPWENLIDRLNSVG